MKQILLSLALLSALNANAAVLTVDKNSNSPGQYTAIQPAITAASPGDTLYVNGATGSYGSIIINKRLTVFGTGYSPVRQNVLVSTIDNVTFDTVTSVSGASASKLAGFYTNAIYDNYGAKGIILERNYVNSSINLVTASSGFHIRHNMINSNISINGCTNLVIENNLIYTGSLYYSSQPSIIISHNVFMNTVGNNYYCTYQVSACTFLNNIFWGTSPLGTSTTGNTYNNNLTFQTPNDVIPGGSNSGTGNLVATNPQFVNVPTTGLSSNYNYNVANASAAHHAGTDGTDLGVYGGVDIMPGLTGMPNIPQIWQMDIANPIIAPSGSLNTTFKAKKND